jgi:hypothetical protein
MKSEYLPQRRKGRKEIKLPDLAFLASWREQIPVLNSHGPPDNLGKVHKLSSIGVEKNNQNCKFEAQNPKFETI